MKREIELEEKLSLLEKEVKILGEDSDSIKLDLEEAVDSIKIEIESLKMTLKKLLPDFHEQYRNAKNIVLSEIDPEWMNKNE